MPEWSQGAGHHCRPQSQQQASAHPRPSGTRTGVQHVRMCRMGWKQLQRAQGCLESESKMGRHRHHCCLLGQSADMQGFGRVAALGNVS